MRTFLGLNLLGGLAVVGAALRRAIFLGLRSVRLLCRLRPGPLSTAEAGGFVFVLDSESGGCR